MKRIIGITAGVLVICIIIAFSICNYLFQDPFYFVKSRTIVEKIEINSDKDKDGILDLDDIILGARKELENKTKYKSTYYEGGYPPENEGVCTDVVCPTLYI